MAAPEEAQLDKTRHIRFFQRCLKSFLPAQYTPYDSTRMTLACFVCSGLDLLSQSSENQLKPQDRKSISKWALALRHPGGGFVGSPHHALPADFYLSSSKEGKVPHSRDANIAATYFALMLLALSADQETPETAFAGLDRKGTLLWLKRLQRADGSFGEVVDDEGKVRGGRDMRYCYLAASIRWCLRGDVKEGEENWVEDINIPSLVQHIRQAQTYDGGMSETSTNESHGTSPLPTSFHTP